MAELKDLSRTWTISSGTWSLMGLEVPAAGFLGYRVLDFNLTNEGGVDGTYRLLKNITGLWLVQQCKRAFEAKGKKGRILPSRSPRQNRSAPALVYRPRRSALRQSSDMPAAIRAFCKKRISPYPIPKARCSVAPSKASP